VVQAYGCSPDLPTVALSTSMHDPIEQHQEGKNEQPEQCCFHPRTHSCSSCAQAKKISPTLLARVGLSESCVLQSTRRPRRQAGFRLRIFAGLLRREPRRGAEGAKNQSAFRIGALVTPALRVVELKDCGIVARVLSSRLWCPFRAALPAEFLVIAHAHNCARSERIVAWPGRGS
jgi:hypothetical protein